MLNIYNKKNKEKLLKEARESYQNLSKERKNKKQKILMCDIEIFLKKKKTKGINMVVNDIKIF